jgi:hypothetical protein
MPASAGATLGLRRDEIPKALKGRQKWDAAARRRTLQTARSNSNGRSTVRRTSLRAPFQGFPDFLIDRTQGDVSCADSALGYLGTPLWGFGEGTRQRGVRIASTSHCWTSQQWHTEHDGPSRYKHAHTSMGMAHSHDNTVA